MNFPGRATWTKHYRNGVELPEIARDDNYDFNFQVLIILGNLKQRISSPLSQSALLGLWLLFHLHLRQSVVFDENTKSVRND